MTFSQGSEYKSTYKTLHIPICDTKLFEKKTNKTIATLASITKFWT